MIRVRELRVGQLYCEQFDRNVIVLLLTCELTERTVAMRWMWLTGDGYVPAGHIGEMVKAKLDYELGLVRLSR